MVFYTGDTHGRFLKIENAGQFCSVRQGFAIVLAQFHS